MIILGQNCVYRGGVGYNRWWWACLGFFLGCLVKGVDNPGSDNSILEVAEGADTANGCVGNEKDLFM